MDITDIKSYKALYTTLYILASVILIIITATVAFDIGVRIYEHLYAYDSNINHYNNLIILVMLIIVCIIFIFNYKKTFYTNWYNYCKRDFKFFNSTEELIKALSISKNDKNCKYDNYTEDMLNEITANNFNKITPREYNTSDKVLISSIHDKINIKMYDVYSRFHNYFTNTDNFKWNIICIINCGNFKLIPIQYTANTPVKIENNTPKFMYNIQENAFIDAAIIRNYNYNLFENNMTVVLNKCIVMYHGYIIDEINMSKFVLLYEKILNRHKRILNLKEDNE